MKQSDIGILLSRVSYGDNSLILNYYTQKEGIQQFIFQGAKKKSNLFNPLTISELTFYERNDSELNKLTQIDLVINPTPILTNPIKSVIAFFVADVIKNSLKTNQKEIEIFEFLINKIEELIKAEHVTFFPITFLADFTYYLGIKPNLENVEPNYFDIYEGEFLSIDTGNLYLVKGEIVNQLSLLFKNQQVLTTSKRQLLELLLKYYKQHIPNFNVENSLSVVRAILLD